jgi:hypothetical protein
MEIRLEGGGLRIRTICCGQYSPNPPQFDNILRKTDNTVSNLAPKIMAKRRFFIALIAFWNV